MKKLDKNIYGFWEVKSQPFKINKIYYVKVFCTNCKKTIKNVKKHNLIKGYSKSCGCISSEKLKKHVKGKPAHNKVDIFCKESKIILQTYKFWAKKRNLNFKLSLEELQYLIMQPCKYCGLKLSNQKNTKKGIFKYNGIDRWDNSIGYEKENCLTCCNHCNFIKRDIENGAKFIEHIQKILNYHNLNLIMTEEKLLKYELRLNAIKQNSPDAERKVAAILIDPKTGAVNAEGYNGFARKAPDHSLPKVKPEKHAYMIHAETNVIYNAVRSGVSTDGKILFCTLSPCKNCLRALWQCGISRIYFKNIHPTFEELKIIKDLYISHSQIGQYNVIEVMPYA